MPNELSAPCRPTELDLAGLAGFFDGEGCCTTVMSGRLVRAHVLITQKNRVPLEEIRKWFPSGVINYASGQSSALHFNTDSSMKEFLEALLPHLRIKGRVATPVLEHLILRTSSKDDPKHLLIRAEIKQLNGVD